MNRLIDTVDLALPIGNPAQASAGQKTERSRDDTGFVADNITKQIAGDHDSVQLAWVLDHQHGGAINEVMAVFDLRELLVHNLGHDLSPETAGRKHVRLVQTPHGQWGLVLKSEVRRKTNNPLDLGSRVRLRVHGVTVAVVFDPVSKVDATRELTDDVEVDATADVGL